MGRGALTRKGSLLLPHHPRILLNHTLFIRTSLSLPTLLNARHACQQLRPPLPRTWSNVVMVGDSPPCTQNTRLSMTAERLRGGGGRGESGAGVQD